MADAADWGRIRALRHPGVSVDQATWQVGFDFELAGPEPLRFTETVTFPPPPRPPDAGTVEAFRRVLDLLYVATGTSYYKVAAPPRVLLDTVTLAPAAVPWAVSLYRHGLGEFAYRNDLPHILDLPMEVDRSGAAGPDTADPLPRRPLVPVGGGKDSVVTVETLRGGGFEPVQVSVNPNGIQDRVMTVAGLPGLRVTRRLDRRVLDLNRRGAYNGHVPVTAINSLIAVATAVLHGLGPVVMSNERSASAPNLSWHGHEINHQWSKGADAERRLRAALAAQAGLADGYFSLLRPLSELRIAALYAGFPAYDGVMTSCNAAFRLAGRSARWCGDCPKCRYVFLALAPFMPRSRLVGIFGADLLDDPGQLPGYRDLAGIDGHKPFECVGEPAEVLAALRMLTDRPEWIDAEVPRRLRAEVTHRDWLPDPEFAEVFRVDEGHPLPEPYGRALWKLVGDDAVG